MYDQETGLYYVNSRYYDAIVGRWLNGDFTGTLDIGFENFAQYNFYVYCWNNPIGMSDPFGTWPNWDTFGKGLLQAAVGVLAVAAVIGTGGTCAPLVALGYAAVATAGVVATGIGASEVYESFSGTNPVRTYLGEPLYDTYKYGSMTVISFSPQIIEMGAQAVCFVAGTIVAAENEQIPIEDVVPGIKVWAYDPDTNRTELKEVVRTFVNETSELVHIKVNNEEIVTTPSHPFYVPKKGWTDAIQLRAGDRLQLLNGEYVIIEQVQHELLETPITVYNFEVEDFHTYYVADTSVLVHNTCGPNGTYEKASYHNNGNSVKSAAPINGQLALDNSVSIGANTSRRIGISDGQFVVLDMTTNGIFHGHVRTWNELTQSMKNALINAGMTNRKGKILG